MLIPRSCSSCVALPLATVALLVQAAAAQDTSSNDSSTVTTIIEYAASVLLVAFSGLFSGLTLGLMGLDLSGLEVRAARRAVGERGVRQKAGLPPASPTTPLRAAPRRPRRSNAHTDCDECRPGQ